MSKNIVSINISINIVVYNGEKYTRKCLDMVLAQTYPHDLIEVNVLDNNSTDSTREIIRSWQSEVSNSGLNNLTLIESKTNLGMWPGQEKLLKHSHGEYIVGLSVDVMIDADFVKNFVEVMEHDRQIGAIQAKIYKYELSEIKSSNFQPPNYKIIDTLGFKFFRSRRIINIGHGEVDRGQYNKECEIFAVEGAVPIFRRQALEYCRLNSQDNKIIDNDYFWYGDDLDLTWRMRLFGWKQVYNPIVIAWHDRKTTKSLSAGWRGFIRMRKDVPMFKRRLDWRNTTLTIIKNDFAINLLRDLPYILWRQLRLWGYFLLFEPSMFSELFKVAKLLPRMLKRRNEIMKKAHISAREIYINLQNY